MTGARELIEEGATQGFAIAARGHALFAAERMEPVAAIPGAVWSGTNTLLHASALCCCVSSAHLVSLLRVAFC